MDEIEPETQRASKSNSKAQWPIIVASIVLVAALIGGAVFIRQKQSSNEVAAQPTAKRNFTEAELSKFDGKDNRECYVAVNGTVYKIEQGTLWQGGEHTTSNGEAYCGVDLSEAIKHSPHGTSKLSTLEIVGKLD